MQNSKNFIMICLFTVVLIFDGVNAFAQGDPYRLLKKGESCPFDSGVVSPVKIFREDTRRINTGDRLIRSFRIEIDSLTKQVAIRGALNSSIEARLDLSLQRQDTLQTTVLKLSNSFDQLRTATEDPGKWYQFKWLPDWVKFGFGFGAAYLIFK